MDWHFNFRWFKENQEVILLRDISGWLADGTNETTVFKKGTKAQIIDYSWGYTLQIGEEVIDRVPLCCFEVREF